MRRLLALPLFALLALAACQPAPAAGPGVTVLPAAASTEAQPIETAPAPETRPPQAPPTLDATSIAATQAGVALLPTSGAHPTPVTILAPGPIALITLGDSLTAGDGDELERGGYPGRLLAQLQALRPGSTLLNLGASGWSSDALLLGDQGLPGQLERAIPEIEGAIREGRSAIALVWIGSNDLWYLYEYGDAAQAPEDLVRFASNIETILRALHNAGAATFIALLDDQSRRPVALAGEAFPSTTPEELADMSRQVAAYNAAIAEKATLTGAWTVDFYNTTLFTDPATLSDDGNHPDAAGYDQIAALWWQAVAPLLR